MCLPVLFFRVFLFRLHFISDLHVVMQHRGYSVLSLSEGISINTLTEGNGPVTVTNVNKNTGGRNACLRGAFLFMALMAPGHLPAQGEPLPTKTEQEQTGMQKIPVRQFVVYAEKPGRYSIRILFSGEEAISRISDISERFKKKQELYDRIRHSVAGRIAIYSFSKRELLQEVLLPYVPEKRSQEYDFIIDEGVYSTGSALVEIPRAGRYVIRPEIISHDPGFTDYTLFFERIHRSK